MRKKMLIKIFKITALTLIIFMSYCANFINGYTEDKPEKILEQSFFLALAIESTTSKSYVYKSTDGVNWSSPIKITDSIPLISLTYGNGKFVAVGSEYITADNESYIRSIFSEDGINWQQSNLSSNYTIRTLNSVTYGASMFVAVGNSMNPYYSYDGVNWSAGTGTSGVLRSVTYGNGKFIAVGDSGVRFYSTDGINWATGTGAVSNFKAVTYGDGKFVAVGESASVLYSNDGINWIAGTGASGTLYSVTYGNGKFVAVGDSPGSNYGIYYSYDGENWSAAAPLAGTYTLNGIVYALNKFIAVGKSGIMLSSKDGINWQQVKMFDQIDSNHVVFQDIIYKKVDVEFPQ